MLLSSLHLLLISTLLLYDNDTLRMSMVIGGIIILSYWGVCRFFALMVAHGLCSGNFCFYIYCIYKVITL